MARATVKATPARPRKAAPANRGHGKPGVAKYDPSRHPRGPDGRFLSKGGASKAPKTPKASKAVKPPKPKLPRKVGTAGQRKGLADQIRKARAGAKTPEARKALLHQVRDLRAKRKAWVRGQGKTQVEKLPKEPKPSRPPREPKPKAAKEKAPKKETKPPKAPKKAAAKGSAEDPVMRRARALQARYGRAGAGDIGEMSRLAGQRLASAREYREQRQASARLGKRMDAVRVAAAAKGDLQAQAELLLRKPPAEMHRELQSFIDAHKSPAREVRTHGMTASEPMHSVQFGQHALHFPANGPAGMRTAAQTARNLTVGDPLHPELARHTKDIYLTTQANGHDSHWEREYRTENFQSSATGGDGNIAVYHGNALGASTFAHEAGHNLATARYGGTKPRATGDFMAAAAREKYPTAYAAKSPAEDFADSVRLYTIDNARLKSANPLRYAVIDRLLRERSYGG